MERNSRYYESQAIEVGTLGEQTGRLGERTMVRQVKESRCTFQLVLHLLASCEQPDSVRHLFSASSESQSRVLLLFFPLPSLPEDH